MSEHPLASCPRCGEQLPERAAFCPACGLQLASDTAVIPQPRHESTPSPVDVTYVSRLPPELQRSAQTIGRTASTLRDRFRATAGTLAIRSEAKRRVAALRAQSVALESEKRQALLALGHAVHLEDDAGTETARERIRTLDEQLAGKGAEMQAILEEAERSIAQRLEVQPTQVGVLPVPEPPPDPAPPGEPPTPAPDS